MSDGPPMRNHRITLPYFRTCSTCLSPSQARFCHCTLRAVAIRAERTLGSLRFARLPFALSGPWEASVTLLEATTPVKLPTKRCPGHPVRLPASEGWYFTVDSARTGVRASQSPTYPTHHSSRTSAKL